MSSSLNATRSENTQILKYSFEFSAPTYKTSTPRHDFFSIYLSFDTTRPPKSTLSRCAMLLKDKRDKRRTVEKNSKDMKRK